ncbi:autotransporter domain-containing protein [Desulfovibrio sp. ZJ200]|uniref:autotransporter domain-containing protein n=1 Tax=Desulfovibrio sp. ZJ200 TaxID=2709792 RepID=UPI0019800665|nr:autotransporter domain-containing protein [Desulfovibrio sp. ZJ200]
MSGGTLEIKTDSVPASDTGGNEGTFTFSSLDVNSFNLSGGNVTLEGKADNPWEKAAYVGAYNGMNITGGTVTMGQNSELFAGNHLKIEGGEITMKGALTGSNTDPSGNIGFGNNAAHIMFSGGENTISGGTITVGDDTGVVDVGVMSAPTLNMTGGKLEVKTNAKLLLQPSEGSKGQTVVYTDDSESGKTGVFNLSGNAAVTVAENGTFLAPYTRINQAGDATVTVNGALWTQKSNYQGDMPRSSYTLSGGTLKIEGDASTNANGGVSNGTLQTGMLKISGGNVIIRGTQGETETRWDYGPYLSATHGADISGGTVTLEGPVHIVAGAKTGENSQLNLSGDAQILMKGNMPLIRASNGRVSLNIKDNAGITVGTVGTGGTAATGYILSRMTNMSGGAITVNDGSTLTVAGGALTPNSDDVDGVDIKGNNGETWNVAEGIAEMSKTEDQGGTFNLSGGKIDVKSGGNLDFATGEVNVIQTGGEIKYAGTANKLAFHGLTVAGGTRTGMDNLTVEAEETVFASRANGVSASTLTVGTSDKAGDLTLTTLTQIGGTVNVNNGTLSVGTLDQDSGKITVGGAGAVSTLTVTGTDAGTSLQTQDYAGDKTVSGTTAGILVANQGTLEAAGSILLKDGFVIQDGVGKIEVAAGGTLKINGLDSIDKNDLNSIKTALFSTVDSKGLLNLGDTEITNLVNDGKVSFTDATGAAAGVETTETLGATVTGANADTSLTGGYKNVESGEDGIKTESGTLQLAGDTEGGNLVANGSDAAPVSVGDGTAAKDATLTLGVTDANNKGTVGEVSLKTNGAGTATLNAVGDGSAEFTTGAITTTTANTGDVNASGASLTSAQIGNGTAAVGTVHASNSGTVASNASIDAVNLSADNGSVSAETAITAPTLSADNGGSVTSGAGITANTALSADNGGSVSATGDISATGTLTANNTGSVSSTSGAITAGALTANGGEVTAKNDITVTGATSLNNGTIQSTDGDVSLNNVTGNVSGNIVADKGAISTTSGQDLAAAEGQTLNLAAGTNINVGTGNIAATNVSAGETITAANVSANSVQAQTLNAAAGAVAVTGGDPATTAPSEVGTLNAATVTLTNGADLTAGTLTMTAPADGSPASSLTVGSADDTRGTTLVVNTLNLNGNALLIDPDWGAPSTNVAVENFSIQNINGNDVSVINGNVGVGQNSMAAFGTRDKNWLLGHVNAVGGLDEHGVTSALGIFEPQVLDAAHGITVDGLQTTAGGFTIAPAEIHFNADSLLVVRAEAALDPAGALSATGDTTATIANNAKLRIAGAEVGERYTVLGTHIDVAATDPEAWSGENFSTDSPMVATGVFDHETGTVTTTLNSARNAFPSLDSELAKVVDSGYLNHEIGTADRYVNASEKGVRFLSRATSRDYLGNDAEQAAVTMESAARMALIGAVPQMTLAANNAAGNAVTQRTSLAQPGGTALQSMASDGSVSGASATEVARSGFALWIMPLYQSANGWGLEGGNFNMDYSGGLGGVAIGADYTFENAIRAGITFNIGGGYATGSGDFNETTNDMSFWGIGAYAGWTKNNFGLTADVNYTSTYNKLEQDLPAAMQMDSLKSDVTAWAISAGLRGEYKFETSVLDITPHVGVRYTSLNTDEYDVKSGGTVLSGDGISQSIWTFPVGVAFSRQIETGNGWHFKPSLDLAVIPAAGDIEARGDVRFTGVTGTAELETQTMDYISYMGQAGLEFGNDNVSFGVNYNLQTGVHSTSHGVFGTFRYEF